MDYIEDLDLEDIESRLYSQVYHASAEPVEESTVITNFHEPSSDYFKRNFRYFEKSREKIQNRSVLTFIALTEEGPVREAETNYQADLSNKRATNNHNTSEHSTYQNPLSFPQNTATVVSTNNREATQNNIIFNQYSIPIIINPDVFSTQPDNCHRYDPRNAPVSKKKCRLRSSKKYNPRNVPVSNVKYSLRSSTNYDLNKVSKTQPPSQNNITIYLTDSDSDECVMVEKMNDDNPPEINTKFPKKYNEADGGTPPEPDDDIIFVSPPPIEVINVDIDEPEGEKGNKSPLEEPNAKSDHTDNLEMPESHFSNDFLDNSNLESNSSNFNFSLHGSDFNSGQSEVVSPQKPMEYCETESSCSTNEQHGRNFSNTVKTIVFDEVEFPREDIFSDKNLENFSSFITPKRSEPCRPSKSMDKSKSDESKSNEVDLSSNASSSESDYEADTAQRDEKLPDLSQVVPYHIPNKKPKKTAHDFFKSAKKVTAEETSESSNSEKWNTRKKRHLNNDIDSQSAVNIDEGFINELKEMGHTSTPNNTKMKKKKKKHNNSILAPPTEIETTQENLSETDPSFIVPDETRGDVTGTDSLVDHSETDPTEKPKKKKKNRDSSKEKDTPNDSEMATQDNANNEHNETSHLSVTVNEEEKAHKKKKKRGNSMSDKITENIVQDVEQDITSAEIIMNHSGQKKKKKKKKHQSENEDTALELYQEPELECHGEENKSNDGHSLDTDEKNRKKKKRDSLNETNEENTSNIINESCNTSTPSTSQQVVEKTHVSKSPIQSGTPDTIVLESDDSDDQIVLSSDSDCDFEILDDVGADLSLNCTITEKNDISQKDIHYVIKKARAPLENYENYSVENIHSQQSDDPAKWQISFRDRATYLNSGTNRGPRCRRCRQRGHISMRCPVKPYPPACTLCGMPDHQEPRCPNKRCTQCGNRGDYSTTYCSQCFKFRHSVCHLCKMQGHIHSTCPDLWRRYHLTNDKGPMIVSKEPTIPRNEQWCSGCARRGHLEHECDYYNRAFPPTNPFVMSYVDVLEHDKFIDSQKEEVVVSTNSPPAEPFLNSSTDKNEYTPPGIPSLLDLPIPDLPLPPPEERMIVPNPANPNFTIQLSNNAIPNDIILQMRLNFDNSANQSNHFRYPVDDVDLNNLKQIKHVIMSMPSHVVHAFLKKQMEYMQVSKIDPRVLRRKMHKYDKLLDIKKPLPENLVWEKNFWYRTVNMFVFGVHKYKGGGLHVNNLTRYVAQSENNRLDLHKRKALFSSYSYIFGCEKHVNVNYYKIIRLLIRKYSNKSVIQ